MESEPGNAPQSVPVGAYIRGILDATLMKLGPVLQPVSDVELVVGGPGGPTVVTFEDGSQLTVTYDFGVSEGHNKPSKPTE